MLVIKVGGNELDNPAYLQSLARAVAEIAEPAVIVHGGGRGTSELMERFGITPRFVEGLRVTDPQTLDLAVMGLVGQASMRLVTALVSEGVRALGLSGADAGLVTASPLVLPGADLGAVGTPVSVQGSSIEALLDAGFVPCLAPICISESGALLNVNADQVAHAVAAALEAERLLFLTDVPGITIGGNAIAFISPEEIETAIAAGDIAGGMIPKSRAAAAAIAAGVRSVVITDLAGLAAISRGESAGTTVVREQ